MTIAKKFSLVAPITAGLLLVAGCAQLSVQGGEKPIHLIVDVNIKVDHELDQFFAFEKSTTQPATAATTTTQPASNEVGT